MKLQLLKPTLLSIFALLGFSFTALHVQGAKYPDINSSYLDSVDYYLARAANISRRALSSLNDELIHLYALPEVERLEKMAQIGRRFEQIDIDSAMVVYIQAEKLAQDIKNQRYTNKFNYRKGSVMPMMGLVREAIETFTAVPPTMVSPEDKFDYFTTGHHIFDAAFDYYRVDSLKQKYKYLSKVYSDSALAYVSPGSVESLYYNALIRMADGDHALGESELKSVMDSVSYQNPLFALAAAEIAKSYMHLNQPQKAKYYFAISAIGDLKAGNRETTSLHRLGRLLSNDGDYARAYDYLSYALDNAVASGSSMRTLEISEIMPAVVKAGRELEQKRSTNLVFIVITLSLVVIVLVFLIVYATHTRNRLGRARRQLVDLNNSKDNYIKKLMQLCGAFLTALENFSKVAARKIKVGQTTDLLAMIESGKVLREQLHTFYDVFDEAFLAVYPDFVEQLNALLLPDKHLSLTEDGQLGTELRIVAFMRLGMDDSAQIARLLGVSLNTIYTYRNKVKTRAINRATFEDDVRLIGRFTE